MSICYHGALVTARQCERCRGCSAAMGMTRNTQGISSSTADQEKAVVGSFGKCSSARLIDERQLGIFFSGGCGPRARYCSSTRWPTGVRSGEKCRSTGEFYRSAFFVLALHFPLLLSALPPLYLLSPYNQQVFFSRTTAPVPLYVLRYFLSALPRALSGTALLIPIGLLRDPSRPLQLLRRPSAAKAIVDSQAKRFFLFFSSMLQASI